MFITALNGGECRKLWDEREQAACILATEERMMYQDIRQTTGATLGPQGPQGTMQPQGTMYSATYMALYMVPCGSIDGMISSLLSL